jgi:hypothetical protein
MPTLCEISRQILGKLRISNCGLRIKKSRLRAQVSEEPVARLPYLALARDGS